MAEGECVCDDLIIRSERISSLTFPTRGTRPHAIGEVQRAAEYADTAGDCGEMWVCGGEEVEGYLWRE